MPLVFRIHLPHQIFFERSPSAQLRRSFHRLWHEIGPDARPVFYEIFLQTISLFFPALHSDLVCLPWPARSQYVLSHVFYHRIRHEVQILASTRQVLCEEDHRMLFQIRKSFRPKLGRLVRMQLRRLFKIYSVETK